MFAQESTMRTSLASASTPLYVLCMVVMGVIFLVDVQLPLGVAGGVPYIAVILLTLWLPLSAPTIIFALGCSLFTVLGFLWSPSGGELWKVISNRSLALLAIWVTSILVLAYKRHLTQLLTENLAFRSMMDLMPHLVFARDAKGGIVAANCAARTFIGHTQEDLQHRPVYALYPSTVDAVAAFERDSIQMRAAPSLQESIETFKNFQGVTRQFKTSKFPLVWAETGETLLTTVAVDETEQFLRIEELTLTDQVIDSSPDHIAVVGLDYRYQRVNRAYEIGHGILQKDIAGLHIQDLLEEEVFEKTVRPRLDQALHGAEVNYESWFTFGNAGRRYMAVTYTPLKEDSGVVLGIVVLAKDLTNKQMAEESLRESEERFRQFAENTEDVIWLTDWDNHRVVYVSPAYEKMWGCTAEALYQDPMAWVNSIYPEDRPQVIDDFMNIATVGHFDHEYRLQSPDGGMRWIRDRGFLIHDQQGNPYRIGGYAQDITDRRNFEQATRRYNELLESEVERRTVRIQELEQRRMQVEKLAALAQVAAGVAHEINNPLANIGQSLEVLKRAISVSHPRYKYIGKIQDSVDRMAHIVRQLYQMYRPDTTVVQPINIYEILRLAVEIMKDAAKKHGVKLVVKVPTSLLLTRVSRNNVTQILCNIIQNALDVSPPQGVVRVGVEEQADSVVILVADKGPGISQEIASRIFEPFFTTKEGTSMEGGMGLGLAVSYRLIESCGGSIDFSTELGQGTIFRVTIPLESNLG